MIPFLLACLAGVLAWSLAEYWLHRSFHDVRGNPLSHDHLEHHRVEGYFAPAWKKALVAGPLTALCCAPVILLFGPGIGSGFALGFVGFYTFYEVFHRRMHTHPPRTAYARRAWLHHFIHHHRAPKSNHGVTSPFWDWVFGTYVAPEPVRVLRRKACPWMLEARGNEPWAGQYLIRS